MPLRTLTRKTIRLTGRTRRVSTGLDYSREADSEIGSVPVPNGVALHQLGDPARVGILRGRHG